MLKDMHIEVGIDDEGMTKSGKTACVTRMAAVGVPAQIGMQITDHKSEGAYRRYDRPQCRFVLRRHVRFFQIYVGCQSSAKVFIASAIR